MIIKISIISILIYLIVCTYMCMYKTIQRHGLWKKYEIVKHARHCWIHSVVVILLQIMVIALLYI